MSSYEKLVKPVLGDLVKGYQRQLSPEDQLTLAEWACMKSLAMDGDYTKDLAGLSSRGDRTTIYRDRRLPVKYVVWIGALDQPGFGVRHVPLADLKGRWSAWLSTLILGFVVIRVYGTTASGSGRHLQAGGWHERDAFTIWPPRTDVTIWPPPMTMNVERLVEFFYRETNCAHPREYRSAQRDWPPLIARCPDCGASHRLQIELPIEEDGSPCRLRHRSPTV